MQLGFSKVCLDRHCQPVAQSTLSRHGHPRQQRLQACCSQRRPYRAAIEQLHTPQRHPAAPMRRQQQSHSDARAPYRHAAAALVAVGLALSGAMPAEAFSKSGLSKALASVVRQQPADPEEQKSRRTAELAHAPEVCHEETTLGKASTAAVSELRLRAALLDEATYKTAQLRKRTSEFVDSMWQSLE